MSPNVPWASGSKNRLHTILVTSTRLGTFRGDTGLDSSETIQILLKFIQKQPPLIGRRVCRL